MEQLTAPERRMAIVVVAGLLAAGAAAVALGPVSALAAALPLVLIAYSSLLADRGARHGPGPTLARVNAELVGTNAALRWQVVHGGDVTLRDASAAALADLRHPTHLVAAFLAAHIEPTEALLDEIAPIAR